jgi:hypothetical protein
VGRQNESGIRDLFLMMLRALVLVSCINFVVSHESESRKWFGNVIISKLEVVVQLTGSLIFFPCLFSL